MNQFKNQRKTEVNTEAICRQCLGTGLNPKFPANLAKHCDMCNGSGLVYVHKVITTTIMPRERIDITHISHANE